MKRDNLRQNSLTVLTNTTLPAVLTAALTSVLITVGTMGIAPAALAQQTAAAIRGLISDQSGNPIANATVTILHQPSNRQIQLQTKPSGRFSAKGLRIGGPYHVTINAAQGSRKVEDVYLTVGETFDLDLTLGQAGIEEVTVVATQLTTDVAVGPSTSFTLSDLQNAPAVNRDIKDLLRADPRVYIDEGNQDAVQCTGANPRFNSLTVDGVRMNDNFGLNSNGYPTERMPFSYDTIGQFAIEMAPFDVQYGGFSACNINAVTKSGENEFHASAFSDYTDDSLSGDSLEGKSIDIGNFTEKRYGFTVGGPLIEDKLFFFVSYEELDGAATFARGPAGTAVASEVEGVSQAQLNEIVDIARTVYNYEPGGLPKSLPEEDEKLLIKFDWNINDNHRAAFIYNYNDGFSIAEADGDSNELELSNHYYERGAELKSYVGHLFSNWSENLSTEVKLGYSELDNRQIPLGGTEFGEVQIRTENDHDGNGDPSFATVYLGADDSRHANKLSYESLNFKLAATYLLDDHTIVAGYEREEYDVFNLFIQEAEGEYRFSSVNDFRNGIASRITYKNAAFTNNKNDAAAEFGYDINTLYVMDEYTLANQDINVVFGLRYDWYTSSDKPVLNPDILAIYGRSNRQNLDGLDLLQPRLGFNWTIDENTELHGGIGLFSGGNPNVWLSNNYSSDGVTQLEARDTSGTPLSTIPFNGSGRPIYDIPQALFDNVAAGLGRKGGVSLQDKNFEIPSSWKFALGGSYVYNDSYVFSADILYSDHRDAAIIKDISRQQIGTAIDGRPIYGSIGGRSEDLMLTNVSGDSGSSTLLSLGVSKSFDFGLDVAFGYAFTKSEEVSPMTSSVAFSNYSLIATDDPNNPDLANSNYTIPHRFTLKLNYEYEFIEGFRTKITLLGSANEGRPYSYAFEDGSMFGDSTGFISRHLLYVPTGVDDPNVIFVPDVPGVPGVPGFDTQSFFDFVEREGLDRGSIMERNELSSTWWTKFDFKIEQELPGFTMGHAAAVYLVVENLGNLLNDEWGVMHEASFPRTQAVVDASIDPGTGQYRFERFRDPAKQSRVRDASLWEMRFGIRYEF